MSPSGDIKADTKAPLPPVKIEQPVTDKTPSSGHANGQDIATQTASPSNGLGTNEILKTLFPALNKYQPEPKPQLATGATPLASHLARLRIKNEDESKNSFRSTTQQVAALNGSSSKAAPIIPEEQCGSQPSLAGGSEFPGVWFRNEVLSGAKTDGPDSAPSESLPLPTTLSRQEVPERERREDGGYVDQAPIELTELIGPADPVVAEEEDRTPPPPPPSPEPAARASFEEFFDIRPSRLGGLGAFAVRELRRGQTILVERPLLRTTHFRLLPDFHRLSETTREAFLALHSGEGDRFSKVERIKKLNSFVVPGGIAIFEIASRFNHACPSARNVQYVFDDERGVLSLTVCQDVVPAGTELSISYGTSTIDLYSTYGFRCACGGCTPLTDDDIRKLEGSEYGNWEW